MKGDKLAKGWLERSEQSKARILAQLRKLVEETRNVNTPYGLVVASVDRGSLYDIRLLGLSQRYAVVTSSRFGPFEDIAAFNRWLDGRPTWRTIAVFLKSLD